MYIYVRPDLLHVSNFINQAEDVTDETIAQRHERSEREENKRFMTYVNMPPQARLRHNRRADSRADSGANTPGIFIDDSSVSKQPLSISLTTIIFYRPDVSPTK